MRGVEVVRKVEGNVGEARERAIKGFERFDTFMHSFEAERTRSLHSGKIFTRDPAQMRHFVDIYKEPSGLRFHFHTGWLASAWSDADRTWAEERVDAVLAMRAEELEG